MLSSGLKSFAGVLRRQSAAFSHETFAQVKAKRKELLDIEKPHEFLRVMKLRGRDQNAVSPRNFLHLLKRCTQPKDFQVAVNGVAFFQRKGADFSPILSSYFINLCVRNENPKAAVDLIIQPQHRLGAWVSRKANLSLLNSLAKTDDVDSMVSVADATLRKGLRIQSKESVSVLLQTANRARSAEKFDQIMDIATKTLRAEELEAIKAEFPSFAGESVAVEEASA